MFLVLFSNQNWSFIGNVCWPLIPTFVVRISWLELRFNLKIVTYVPKRLNLRFVGRDINSGENSSYFLFWNGFEIFRCIVFISLSRFLLLSFSSVCWTAYHFMLISLSVFSLQHHFWYEHCAEFLFLKFSSFFLCDLCNGV